MKNDFRLGLVAEIKDEEGHPFSPVMSEDWKYFTDFFRSRGDVVLFDWKTLRNDFTVPEYVLGSQDSLEVVRERTDIRDLCDVAYIGQLGKISQDKVGFLNFLNIIEGFPGIVVNPISTIKGNLSKQYLIDLQEKGVNVIPTLDVRHDATLEELANLDFPRYGKSDNGVILKPKIFGEQGIGVVRLEDFSNEGKLHEYLTTSGEVIAQPLIEDIFTRGENSFIFTGRKYSHGLNKITGNFKINYTTDSNSRYSAISPTDAELELCEAAFDALPDRFGYVRVDIISGDNPMIGEVELVNPACYLADSGALETYSMNLNERLNEIFERGRV
jgi:glutathione synthase/RimK-type ligase-like ATP-grasp enzyme